MSNVLHVACFVVSLDSLYGVTVPKTANPFFDTTPVHSPKNFFSSDSQEDTQFTVILSQLPLTDPLLCICSLTGDLASVFHFLPPRCALLRSTLRFQY